MSFAVEERVLCFHGPLLYEAKILQVREKGADEGRRGAEASNKGPLFLVHYKGWKRTWDEWVPESRVRKWTEDNLKHSKELKNEALAAQKRLADNQKRSTTLPVSVSSNGGGPASTALRSSSGAHVSDLASIPQRLTMQSRTKRSRGEVDGADDSSHRAKLALQIPDSLKARLIDDWEWITKDERLVPLPRKPNALDIVRELRSILPPKRPGSAQAELEDEFFEGFLDYFDRCLGTVLLYRFERQQYADVRKHYGENASASGIYGAEHLLRLIATMNELVGQTSMDNQATSILREYLRDLLTFIAQRQKTFFVDHYDTTPASYSRMLNYQ
ncbi:Esa1p-associated factor [Savitreella phatthalungensis]